MDSSIACNGRAPEEAAANQEEENSTALPPRLLVAPIDFRRYTPTSHTPTPYTL